MKLGDLLGDEIIQEWPNLEILSLSVDSRSMRSGCLFFALSGNKENGSSYISEAQRKGAVAVVTEENVNQQDFSIPIIIVKNARLCLARAAARFYTKIPKTLVAVTGTSGKTSVVTFLRQIWHYAGLKAASIGTIGIESEQGISSTGLTTPDTIKLYESLSDLAERGFTHIALEASSHGIEQYRLDGLPLAAAAFTNLSRDHLDYHKDMDEYFATKMQLFQRILPCRAPIVIYGDDIYGKKLISVLSESHSPLLTVGWNGEFIQVQEIMRTPAGQSIKIFFQRNCYTLTLPFAGTFQVANFLVAMALALQTNISLSQILESAPHLQGASGRLERVGFKNSSIPIYVDYAHKPEALETVLKAVRDFTTRRIILVFGCGGDRDKGKREIMGEIAEKYADVVIVTDDNPRNEDPAIIRAEIKKTARKALEIGDRAEAIKEAINLAQTGDSVIIAGKGHETGQIIGQNIIKFSDKETILKILKEQ